MHSAQTLDKNTSPILIVDKEGVIGNALIEKLKDEALIIFISKEEPKEKEDIIFIPFKNTPAKIPDNNYSYMIVVDDPSSWVRESLRPFAQKADFEKTPFIYITDLNMKRTELIYDVSRFHRSKTMVLGDIFNTESILFESKANKFVSQAREEGRIDVPGDGTDLFYPISFKDAINGLVEGIFDENHSSVNYIFPKHPISYLAFAHALQKENPSLKIDFVKKTEEEKVTLDENGRFLLKNEFSLKDSLKAISTTGYKKRKTEEVKTIVQYQEKTKKRRKLPKIIFFLILLIVMPWVLTLSSLFVGLKSLEHSVDVLKKGDLKQALSYSNFAYNQLAFSEYFSKVLSQEMVLLKFDYPLTEKIQFGKSLAETETNLLKAVVAVSEGNTGKDDLVVLINNIKSSLELFQKQKALNNESFPQIEKYSEMLALASSTTPAWNELFGLNGERKYLILFQNNMELRPGGGFIGSYGLLTLEKGRVTEFKIHDVYDADGQLKGHVEPPFAIRRYLGKVHWYLRDSNFDVNYPSGAASAAYFLNLETGEKINGVIGIDVTFIKNLLEAIGPVYVSDYKETVNAENVFLLTESHAEKDFFPGSTQKKDFLRSLSKTIELQITKDKNLPVLALLSAVQKSLQEKHLLFALDDKSTQSIFSLNNWASSIPTGFKKDELTDFVGISEANLGANKANAFVKRSVSKETKINEQGEVSSVLTVSYKNSSDGKWPGGDYINYFRVILNEGAEITEIEIDNKKQETVNAITNFIQYESKTFKPPTGLEIEKYNQDGKTVYGFLTNTPAGKLKTIKISYILKEKINVSKTDNAYNFYFYKQPGTEEFPLDFSVQVASNLKFKDLGKELKKEGSRAMTSIRAVKDESISINLGKN